MLSVHNGTVARLSFLIEGNNMYVIKDELNSLRKKVQKFYRFSCQKGQSRVQSGQKFPDLTGFRSATSTGKRGTGGGGGGGGEGDNTVLLLTLKVIFV
jgi:hypothetical protein